MFRQGKSPTCRKVLECKNSFVLTCAANMWRVCCLARVDGVVVVVDGRQRRLRGTSDGSPRRAVQPAHQAPEHVSDHLQPRDGNPVQKSEPDRELVGDDVDDSGGRHVDKQASVFSAEALGYWTQGPIPALFVIKQLH